MVSVRPRGARSLAENGRTEDLRPLAESEHRGAGIQRPRGLCSAGCRTSLCRSACSPWQTPICRAGRGQVGPCLTDEAHRPLPERRPYVSRYAGARTLQQRSLRQTLQVESSYLLCSRPTQLLTHIYRWVGLSNLSSNYRTGTDRVRDIWGPLFAHGQRPLHRIPE